MLNATRISWQLHKIFTICIFTFSTAVNKVSSDDRFYYGSAMKLRLNAASGPVANN